MSHSERPETQTALTRRMIVRSLIAFAALIGVCFSALIARLAYVQLVEGDEWTARAVSQQLSDSIVTPHRGSIYDCNGKVLAQSAEVWKIFISPRDIAKLKIYEKNAAGEQVQIDVRALTADGLSALLGLDRDALYETAGKTNSQYEVIKSKVEYTLKEKVADWVVENHLTGCVFIITDYKRYYPMGSLLSNVIGFTGTDNTGLEGLEAAYEKTLAGTAGRVVTAQNGVGGELPVEMEYSYVVDAENGNNLELTIDSYIQAYAEKYLEEAVKSTGVLNRGSVIVQNVNTGGILAMATKGDYNPNTPFEVADPTVATMLEQLSGTEKNTATVQALQKQWQNKPLVDTYEPGSVFKVFTAAMALEEGVVNKNTTFTCTGGLRVPGWHSVIRCHKKTGHGLQTFSQGISNSCNPFFMTVGMNLGGETFFKYFSSFGFTEKTGIDMIGEQSNAGLYHGVGVLSSETDKSSLATSAFGQTFKVTPLQVITAMSAVANGGYLMEPYVVSKVTDSKGNVVQEVTPTVKRQVISGETARLLASMLQESATTGGAKNAYVAGYRVAGKTGTSEKRDTEADDVVSSFCGFAPADNPQVAILVMLDDPQTEIRYGGTLAAPVGQKILADVLPYLGIEPEYTEKELAAMNRVTPSVMGKELTSAQTIMADSGLKVRIVGDGDSVIDQIPAPGTTIPQGGTVVLYTDEESMEQTVKMPNFSGCTLLQATQRAETAGVNLVLSGVGLGTGDAKATEQDVPPGTEVPPGTAVTVRFVYQDAIA